MKKQLIKTSLGFISSGEEIFLKATELDSEVAGPTVYLQANIHGPEIAGTPVLYELIKILEKELISGKVILLPQANPWATNAKFAGTQQGYTNINQDKFANWNRIYPDLSAASQKGTVTKENLTDFVENWIEQKTTTLNATKEDLLAAALLKLALQADYVVDIHCADNCIPHLYYFEHQLEHAKSFGISTLVQLPYEFNKVFDETLVWPWFLNKTPEKVEAFTLELPGRGTVTNETIQLGVSSILSYLAALHCVDKKYLQNKLPSFTQCDENNHSYIYSQKAGIFIPSVMIGETISKGQEIGILYTDSENQIAIHSPHKALVYQLPLNQSVETGFKMLGIFVSPKQLK